MTFFVPFIQYEREPLQWHQTEIMFLNVDTHAHHARCKASSLEKTQQNNVFSRRAADRRDDETTPQRFSNVTRNKKHFDLDEWTLNQTRLSSSSGDLRRQCKPPSAVNKRQNNDSFIM
jgi:hypothetical protein